MIDIRYHLASIVAVFLALGFGLLAGAQLGEQGTLTREHTRLIEGIEASVERIRVDNRRLAGQLEDAHRQLAAEREYIDVALGELLAGQLQDVRLDIVANELSERYSGRVARWLRAAGANVDVHSEEVPSSALDAGAFTVYLWGAEDEPIRPHRVGAGGAAVEDAGSVPMDGGNEAAFEDGDEPDGNRWPEGTIWGWPAAADGTAGTPTPDGVHSIGAVDTPTGLLALIGVLGNDAEGLSVAEGGHPR